MNVLYEKQRINRAMSLRKLQRQQAIKKEKERLEAIKLAKFNENIRKDDGKLDLQQLKKLNSVYKTNYVKMIREDSNNTESKLDKTEKKLMDSSTDVIEMIWGIEDTKLTWDN